LKQSLKVRTAPAAAPQLMQAIIGSVYNTSTEVIAEWIGPEIYLKVLSPGAHKRSRSRTGGADVRKEGLLRSVTLGQVHVTFRQVSGAAPE